MRFNIRMGKYQFDRQVWIIFAVAVVASFGFGVVFPFLAIYLANEMQLGEILTGVIMMGYMMTGTFFMIAGGAWADKFGRKKIMVISLVGEAFLITMWAFASDFWGFIAIALAEGALGTLYMPAANAMVADLVPTERRPQAYSVIRIAFNFGTVLGPLFGSVLIITLGIRTMFILSGIVVMCAAAVIFLKTRETLTDKIAQEFRYSDIGKAIRDRPFMLLCGLLAVTFFTYAQIFTSLPVYANTELDVSMSLFALLFATNAGMVVLLQIPITGQAVKMRRTSALTLGQGLMFVGMLMIFIAQDFYGLLAAIAVLTFGEIFHAAVFFAVMADLAPEKLRGTYMGFMGVMIGLGEGLGMLIGMSLLELLSERALTWLVIAGLNVPAIVGYYLMRRVIPKGIDTGTEGDIVESGTPT